MDQDETGQAKKLLEENQDKPSEIIHSFIVSVTFL